MERNIDIIRELLFKIERELARSYIIEVKEEDSFTDEEMIYHIKLLRDGGFIKARVDSYGDNTLSAAVDEITWSGHDFIDSMRNENVWNKTKDEVSKQGMRMKELPFEVVKGLLNHTIKQIYGM